MAQEPIRILKVHEKGVTQPSDKWESGSGLYTVPLQLSATPSNEWGNVFVRELYRQPMTHPPRSANVIADKIYLEGTTLEDIDQRCKGALKSAVQRTNAIIAASAEQQRQELELQRLKEEEHQRKVTEAAKRIKFD